MMHVLKIRHAKKYKKDFKKAEKQRKNIQKLDDVLEMLIHSKPLPIQYREHKLIGNWDGHISLDWLLVYKKEKTALVLVRMGSHSEVFFLNFTQDTEVIALNQIANCIWNESFPQTLY